MPTLLSQILSTSAYGLFISHAWDYAFAYEGVVRRLDADINFKWNDLSIPIENPIKMSPLLPKSNRRILKELEERIKVADALLVLTGMYDRHSGWIQSEIEIARDFGKPIIGVKPQGQESIPAALQSFACELVGWTTASIVSAIRRHASPSHCGSNRPVMAAQNIGKALYPPPSLLSKSVIPSSGISAPPVFPRMSALTPSPSAPQNVVPSGGFGGSDARLDNLAILLSLYDKK
jgi:hypothetical protein